MRKILDAAGATGEGSVYQVIKPGEQARWQVQITGTATVVIKGRANSSAPWATLVAGQSVSAAGVVPDGWLGEIVAEVTAFTSGTVSVWTSQTERRF